MNTFTAVFWIFTGSFLIIDAVSSSVCCPKVEHIAYSPVSRNNCSSITGGENYIFGVCIYKTCADLLDHKDKLYCSKGNCNNDGCGCEGGCIQLDQWGRAQVFLLEKNRPVIRQQDLFLIKYKKLVKQIHTYRYRSQKLDSITPIGFF